MVGWVGLYALTSLQLKPQQMEFGGDWTQPSPDFFILLLAFWVTWWIPRLATLTCLGAGLLLLIIPIYRAAATAMPLFYEKPFLIFEDIYLVPSLIHLMTHNPGAMAPLDRLRRGWHHPSRTLFLDLQARSLELEFGEWIRSGVTTKFFFPLA